jgi:integrase
MFNWAAMSKRRLVTDNPFRDGSQAAIKFGGRKEEPARTRRLRSGEGDRLLAACKPHLRALVEAALETGCRKGELLSLQWWQVRFEPKAEIFLPAVKTKTKKDRRVPISSRLRPILEMRATDADGNAHPAEGYVFGNEVGEQVGSVKRAWELAILKAHGHRPGYVRKRQGEKVIRTAGLDPASREALRQIDLNFHDLRREAGSRWLDGGVPLHRVQMWLGHSNIAQTSTYLRADAQDDDLVMRRFEQQTALQRIATEGATGGTKRPSSDTMTDSETLKHTEIH